MQTHQSITEVLMEIRGGAALKDAGAELAEVVAAVKATGKKGSITLKIDIEPDKTDDTVVTFQPDITVKKPKKPYAKGIFFVDEKTGRVSREDPRQLEMLAEREAERDEKMRLAHEQGITHIGRGFA